SLETMYIRQMTFNAVVSLPKLPFFSLVTLRQAVRDLSALGYQAAFTWIKKPAAVGVKPTKAAAGDQEDGAVIEDDEAA
ncbi:hypothetical protein, partial [Roseovarius tolerans]